MSYREKILKIMRRLDEELRKEGKKVMHAEILSAEKYDEKMKEKEEKNDRRNTY